MRVRSRHLYLFLGALVLFAGAAWWWRTETLATSVRADAPGTTASLPDPIQREAPAEARDAPLSRLPPDAPIDQMWTTWQGAAQAGDSQAACRLAIETLRCSFQLRMAAPDRGFEHQGDSELARLARFQVDPLEDFRSSLQESRTDSPERASTGMAAFLEESQKRAKRCETMRPEWPPRALELLRASALAGQPDAQTLYVSGDGWLAGVKGGIFSPIYDPWTREAPLLLARMLDAGHPDAPGLLAGAYSGHTWLSGLYPRDLERAAAYVFVNARLLGKPHLAERMVESLNGEVKTRARASADSIFTQKYAHYRGRKPDHWLSPGQSLMYPTPHAASAPTPLCESGSPP